jgi:glycosyltransferase involved in cell wall biosynthesis
MDKKKIVFVINDITITRCLKRVGEFINNGYEVDVYGFEKEGEEVYATPDNFSISVIGKFSLKQSYYQRLMVYYKSLRQLYKKYKNQDVIFYYFFFNIAFAARLLSSRPYIYEESDMPYTKMRKCIRNWLSGIDKKIIKKSMLTVMTSEGFIDYHFGDERPNNIVVVSNRVNPLLLKMPYQRRDFDINHLSFAFVGGFRYKSIINFATVIAEQFPQHEFHAYGNILEYGDELKALCENYGNIHFHDRFRNPDDLPAIYEKIDLVLATYDATSINAQYAEPNKMYEAIFFRTPIIVSSNTFLAKKVSKLGIGYHINALDKQEIISFVNGLTKTNIDERIIGLEKIPQESATNKNPELFDYIKKISVKKN